MVILRSGAFSGMKKTLLLARALAIIPVGVDAQTDFQIREVVAMSRNIASCHADRSSQAQLPHVLPVVAYVFD